jgi:predicted RNA-binding protein with PIN domain
MDNGKVVVIDGYNALFRLAHLQYGDQGFQLKTERDYFVRLLSERNKEEVEEIIVFDGAGDDFQLIRKGHQWIIFTRGDTTADQLILELLNLTHNTATRLIIDHHDRQVIVVTDDRELREKVNQIRPEAIILHVSSLIEKASL